MHVTPPPDWVDPVDGRVLLETQECGVHAASQLSKSSLLCEMETMLLTPLPPGVIVRIK